MIASIIAVAHARVICHVIIALRSVVEAAPESLISGRLLGNPLARVVER
jgi:hypothetical protein